jgi:integrase
MTNERLSKEDRDLVQQLEAAKPTEKVRFIAAGESLRLKIEPTGTKVWCFNYQRPGVFNAKGRRVQNTLTFGEFPGVTLTDARLERDKAKDNVRKGIDPGGERAKAKIVQRSAAPFRKLADDWWKVKIVDEGRSASVIQRDGYLRAELVAGLANRPIAEIEAPEILEVLRRASTGGRHDKALRMRAMASRIFRFGIACGVCKTDPARDLVDALTKPVTTNLPAIVEPAEVGKLMSKIYAARRSTIQGQLMKAATEMQALVFQRSGNVIEMEWTEINEAGDTWIIPVGKLKCRGRGRKDHYVPLSKQAQAILARVRPLTEGKKYVFSTGKDPQTQNLMNRLLRDLGYDTKSEHSAHGFRTMASTINNGDSEYRFVPSVKGIMTKAIVELQLAHGDEDQIAAIYDRGELRKVRVELMQHWADVLDKLRMSITIRLAA